MAVIDKICRLIPLFVFCALLNLFMTQGVYNILRDVWKPIVMLPVVSIILLVIVFTALGLKFRCNPFKVIKVLFPVWLISVTTGSRMASYSTNVDILENNLGVSKKMSRLGLFVSGKLYPTGTAIYLTVMVVFFVEKYNIDVNFGWMVMAFIMTVLLTFAGPPVPGELLVIFGVIAKQLGFPDESLVILASVDVFLDGFTTGVSFLLRNAELIFESGSYHELNVDKLRSL